MAARLGGASPYRRDGKLIFCAPLSIHCHELRFDPTASLAVKRVATSAYPYAACLERLAGAGTGPIAVGLTLPGLGPRRVGVEWTLSPRNGKTLTHYFTWTDRSGQFRRGSVVLDLNAGTVAVVAPEGGSVLLGSFRVGEWYNDWFLNLKVVLDLVTLRYARVMVDGWYFDASAVSLQATGPGSLRDVYDIGLEMGQAQPGSALLMSNLLVTVDEP